MTIKYFHNYLFLLIVTLFFQVPLHANCANSYTVGFFNGVWNTQQQAIQGRKELKILIGTTYNNQPIRYESFYNHTGSSVGATALQDLAETFIQRSAEIDASGELGKRFEYFWEFLGSSESTFLDKIKGIFPHAASLFDSLYTTFMTKLVGIISYMLSNPPMEADYAAHNGRLDILAANGEKLMLVAHSQGNLFVNHAYDHILPVVTKDRVATVHIAPASPTLRGDYVLAGIDKVINLMRVQGASSVPANNIDLNFSSADVSGHTLIGTYLDSIRDGRAKVKIMIETRMGTLKYSCSTKRYVMYLNITPYFGGRMGYGSYQWACTIHTFRYDGLTMGIEKLHYQKFLSYVYTFDSLYPLAYAEIEKSFPNPCTYAPEYYNYLKSVYPSLENFIIEFVPVKNASACQVSFYVQDN